MTDRTSRADRTYETVIKGETFKAGKEKKRVRPQFMALLVLSIAFALILFFSVASGIIVRENVHPSINFDRKPPDKRPAERTQKVTGTLAVPEISCMTENNSH